MEIWVQGCFVDKRRAEDCPPCLRALIYRLPLSTSSHGFEAGRVTPCAAEGNSLEGRNASVRYFGCVVVGQKAMTTTQATAINKSKIPPPK
jgi:hypothetical protein